MFIISSYSLCYFFLNSLNHSFLVLASYTGLFIGLSETLLCSCITLIVIPACWLLSVSQMIRGRHCGRFPRVRYYRSCRIRPSESLNHLSDFVIGLAIRIN